MGFGPLFGNLTCSYLKTNILLYTVVRESSRHFLLLKGHQSTEL